MTNRQTDGQTTHRTIKTNVIQYGRSKNEKPGFNYLTQLLSTDHTSEKIVFLRFFILAMFLRFVTFFFIFSTFFM